ncbi:MAG: MFS transporter [Blastomonas sp.]
MGAIATTADQPLFSVHSMRVITGSGLGLFMGTGVLLLFTMGIFIRPIEEATGWSRATIGFAAIPASFMLGALGGWVGSLVDRFGPRKVLIWAIGFQLVGMLGLAFGPFSAISFVGFFVLASILGCVQTPVPFSYVIVGWFKARRGIAMGLTFTFAGLGIATLPPVAAFLIESFGWRMAYASLGLMAVVIALPAALWLVRDPPVVEVRDTGDLPGLTLAETLRRPMFWVLAMAFFINAIVATAGSISLPTILADNGVAPTTAAFAMSLVGVALIIGRLGAGLLLDRFPAMIVTALLFTAPVIGHALLLGGITPASVIMAALFFGIATGAEGDAMSYVLSRAFGMRDFGKIFGLSFFGYAFGTGLGPAMMNILHERFGGYATPLTIFAIGGAVAVIGIALYSRARLQFD